MHIIRRPISEWDHRWWLRDYGSIHTFLTFDFFYHMSNICRVFVCLWCYMWMLRIFYVHSWNRNDQCLPRNEQCTRPWWSNQLPILTSYTHAAFHWVRLGSGAWASRTESHRRTRCNKMIQYNDHTIHTCLCIAIAIAIENDTMLQKNQKLK